MKIDSYFPSENLKQYVQKYLIIESEEGIQNKILPNTNLVLSFQLRGRLQSEESNSIYDLPNVGLAGFRKTARNIIYSKNSSALLVIFSDIGAFSFFKEPISEFYGKSVSLEDLFNKRTIQFIEEQLFDCRSNAEKIRIIESFLLQIKQNKTLDPFILQTLWKIKKTDGNIKIGEIKQGLPISLDLLEKKFKSSVGTTLKHFCNLLRIRKTISSHSNESNLTSLAYKAGYFDQSHFNKEFKLFTGTSPKEFFKHSQNW